MSNNNLELKLSIICINGIQYEKYVHSFLISLKDGLMLINKNYSSVIEQVKQGNLKIYEESQDRFVSYEISDGWMVVSANKCSIYLSYANKLK